MNEGYRVKEYGQPVKRYCQTLDLKDEPELIKEYVKRHSRAEAWPEIREGYPRCRHTRNGDIHQRIKIVHDCGNSP